MATFLCTDYATFHATREGERISVFMEEGIEGVTPTPLLARIYHDETTDYTSVYFAEDEDDLLDDLRGILIGNDWQIEAEEEGLAKAKERGLVNDKDKIVFQEEKQA